MILELETEYIKSDSGMSTCDVCVLMVSMMFIMFFMSKICICDV
jgi:hypothetical protein